MNAAIGLGRLGDVGAHVRLVECLTRMKGTENALAVETALESDELASPVLVGYYVARSQDQELSPAERARAADLAVDKAAR